MPTCTNHERSSGCWACPKCPKRNTPLHCWHWTTDKHGRPMKAECNLKCCNTAGHHSANPGEHHEHLKEVHGG